VSRSVAHSYSITSSALKAGLNTVTSGFEIMGGPTTGLTFTSYEKFRADNPRIFAAVNKAFDESLDWINADKRRAAKLYIKMTNERKLSEDDLTASFLSQDMVYTKVPSRLGKIVDFLHRVGLVKSEPASLEGSVLPGGVRAPRELRGQPMFSVRAAATVSHRRPSR
jgi:NitT/TauT family transport system substrate-binding protein